MTKRLIPMLVMALLLAGCWRTAPMTEPSIVPEPMFVAQKDGLCVLDRQVAVAVSGLGQNSPTVKYIMKSLRHVHMRPSLVALSEENDLMLMLNDTLNDELGDEGYLLEVRHDGVSLSANTERGLFYGYQTLLQMLPADVVNTTYRSVTLPECTILDRPRFEWRGLCINLSGTALGQKTLRKVVDVMASYKLNRLCIEGGWWNADSTNWMIDSLTAYNLSEINDLRDYAAAMCVELHWDTMPPLAHDAATGLRMAREGEGVVMQPDEQWSLDRYQANPRFQPQASDGLATLGSVYAYDPMPKGAHDYAETNILGAQGVLLTDCTGDPRHMEYMLLPRLLALSECLWSPAGSKDWQRFRKRVEAHKEHLQARGYNYCEGSFTPQFLARRVDDGSMNISIETEVPNTYIFYTTDSTTPTRQSAIYLGPINLQRGTHIKILPVYKDVVRDSVYEFVIK